MDIGIYQSGRGEIVLVPGCLQPNLEAIRRFGALFPRGTFQIHEDPVLFDFDNLIACGYALVGAAQLAQLRAAAPAG